MVIRLCGTELMRGRDEPYKAFAVRAPFTGVYIGNVEVETNNSKIVCVLNR